MAPGVHSGLFAPLSLSSLRLGDTEVVEPQLPLNCYKVWVGEAKALKGDVVAFGVGLT